MSVFYIYVYLNDAALMLRVAFLYLYAKVRLLPENEKAIERLKRKEQRQNEYHDYSHYQLQR